jgi:hypothetical protein
LTTFNQAVKEMVAIGSEQIRWDFRGLFHERKDDRSSEFSRDFRISPTIDIEELPATIQDGFISLGCRFMGRPLNARAEFLNQISTPNLKKGSNSRMVST